MILKNKDDEKSKRPRQLKKEAL